jgi:hypothetical protein
MLAINRHEFFSPTGHSRNHFSISNNETGPQQHLQLMDEYILPFAAANVHKE